MDSRNFPIHRGRLQRIVAAVGLAVASALLFTAGAGAAVPGTDGRIAFNHTLPGNDGLAEIVTAESDGTDGHVLSLPYATETFSTPVWSPDGNRLLISHVLRFTTSGDCCLPFRPVIVNADGTGAKLLTMPWAPLDSDCLVWTPDQTRLLCGIGDNQAGIFSLRASDGLNPVRLTTNPYGNNDQPADVSPRGDQFVFERFRPGPSGSRYHAQQDALFVENISGSGLHRITGWGAALRHDVAEASWSPDGQRIIASNVEGHLFTVHPDGTGLTIIHLQTGMSWSYAFQPHWSPSGTRIIFAMNTSGAPEGLYTARPDGSDVKRVTNPDTFDNAPSWGSHS
jgi:Tol biopolymer transport system component